MRNVLKYLSVGIVLMACGTAIGQDRIDHFKGEPAPTLEQALINFVAYNAKLEALLAGELQTDDMVEIHQITYTLENALERIRQDLADLADTLEEVHVASETMNYEVVREAGTIYLEVSKKLAN
ncbi:MAG: hypothetical protein LAT53_09800 [Idiomarina sp.]|nr:hypothetical protein [Idiomarina sp.]